MVSKSLISKVVGTLFLTSLSFALLADVNIETGKTLFKNNCAQCHNRNMKDKLTGPALGGYMAADRWAGDKTAVYSWIRNSQAMVSAGHPYANKIFNEFNKSVMNPFPQLTDDEIGSILLYVDEVFAGRYPKVVAAGPVAGAAKESSSWLYWGIFAMLALLALLLARIIGNLGHLLAVRDGQKPPSRSTLAESLTSRGMVSFCIFALVLIAGSMTVNNTIGFGRQQGYAPEQPIKFSHATHADVNKIDCNYCHDGARRSKQSVIPATNTCMNCHKAVKKGTTYGTAEITKIFVSAGYDPNQDIYLPDYEKMDQAAIEKIFKKWIRNEYMKSKTPVLTTPDEDTNAEVDHQWKEIVASLTNETKKQVQGPIEWKRIHNLPDHVYFNHSQHVTAGKVACQTCHGKVEKMETLQQYAPLSMGWCINCHRETAVQFKDNPYYESYKRYHEEFKAKKDARQKVTVEEIGGMECQKCHY